MSDPPGESAAASERFDPASLASLDPPVQRYFAHALRPGGLLAPRVRLTMAGRIKVGRWMGFAAEWEGDARSFVWRARVGFGPLRFIRVTDRYANGAAAVDARLLGRVPLVQADDADTARSGAGRAAIEAATWAPASLLPQRGVDWRAESDELIVASWEVPPERPEVRLRIDADGALQAASLLRWDSGEHGRRGYLPFGAEIHAERRFGDLVVPSRLTVGWGFGTPDWAPFFEAEVTSAAPATPPERAAGQGEALR